MKTLYFDCVSGASGDMIIGSLIDLGADAIHLKQELLKLAIGSEYEITVKKVNKNGITATKFDVILKEEPNQSHFQHHDPSHEHTHDHGQTQDLHEERSHNHHSHESHEHTRDHHCDEGHGHSHDHHLEDHSHANHAHSHSHHHRTFSSIKKMIEESTLQEDVKSLSITIFQKIAEAEGKIHGVSIDKVHFHEVGAVDSIIDIVGTAILICSIKPDLISSSSLPVGTGKIAIDHGIYPVPAPATLEILKGVPIEQSNIRFELTTPTGAAIIAVLAEQFGSIPSMTVESIGYGAGTKTFPSYPNVIRTIIGHSD
ncbi:LarC family nickel insertion protein [Cytobacillus oceanisediminis]|uniref:LarC family nickel insertion protein n=1 Tax=Cytobacillus oceanisediminis TaxID=665099 RepID=UPI001FB38C20|nr:LarC family nickel insertion protein [Cytobacillus oceanisediminis]UOE53135.1 DUF111 family protein [Cytobacillus oceanisediminis]